MTNYPIKFPRLIELDKETLRDISVLSISLSDFLLISSQKGPSN